MKNTWKGEFRKTIRSINWNLYLNNFNLFLWENGLKQTTLLIFQKSKITKNTIRSLKFSFIAENFDVLKNFRWPYLAVLIQVLSTSKFISPQSVLKLFDTVRLQVTYHLKLNNSKINNLKTPKQSLLFLYTSFVPNFQQKFT